MVPPMNAARVQNFSLGEETLIPMCDSTLARNPFNVNNAKGVYLRHRTVPSMNKPTQKTMFISVSAALAGASSWSGIFQFHLL